MSTQAYFQRGTQPVGQTVEYSAGHVDFAPRTTAIHPIETDTVVVRWGISTGEKQTNASLQAVIPIIHSCEDDGR